jgi:hypothetical protein
MGVIDGEPFPEQITDQDLRVEVSLPSKAESQTVGEIHAVFERSSHKPISLDKVIRLFHLDPGALIWECEEMD